MVTRGIALTARRPLRLRCRRCRLPMGVSVGHTPGALPVHTGAGLCSVRHFSSPWLSVATLRHGNLGWQARLGLKMLLLEATGRRLSAPSLLLPSLLLPAALLAWAECF